MFPTTFRFNWQSGFREDFFKSTNPKQELPVAAMFKNPSPMLSRIPRASIWHYLAWASK
jgi:hypothetical protein